MTHHGRFAAGNRELLDQFCARVVEAAVPLSRSWLHIRTLHPEFADPDVNDREIAGYSNRIAILVLGCLLFPAPTAASARGILLLCPRAMQAFRRGEHGGNAIYRLSIVCLSPTLPFAQAGRVKAYIKA